METYVELLQPFECHELTTTAMLSVQRQFVFVSPFKVRPHEIFVERCHIFCVLRPKHMGCIEDKLFELLSFREDSLQ